MLPLSARKLFLKVLIPWVSGSPFLKHPFMIVESIIIQANQPAYFYNLWPNLPHHRVLVPFLCYRTTTSARISILSDNPCHRELVYPYTVPSTGNTAYGDISGIPQPGTGEHRLLGSVHIRFLRSIHVSCKSSFAYALPVSSKQIFLINCLYDFGTFLSRAIILPSW